MFRHLYLLFAITGLFGSFITDNEAGGSIDYESYDSDIDDDEPEASGEEDNKVVADDSKELDSIMKRLEDAEMKLATSEQEKMVSAEISRLSQEHKGFNADAVKSKLKEIHKTDPEKAAMLNNPIGWENLWLKELAPKDVNNDDISFGRNVDPVDRHEEFIEKINSGEGLSLDEQAAFFA